MTSTDIQLEQLANSECLYGYYPPAHKQFELAPYKSMATIDDYSKIIPNPVEPITLNKEIGSANQMSNNSSVLNARLDSIRQQLSRNRIDMRKIRRDYVPHLNGGVKSYMGIPEDWNSHYPEPTNLSLLTETKYVPRNIKSATSSQRNEDKLDENQDTQRTTTTTTLGKYTGIMSRTKSQNIIKRPSTAPGIVEHTNEASKKSALEIESKRPQTHESTFRSNASQSNKLIKKMISSSDKAQSYKEDLDKYQWLMEIQGDPFDLKKPHLPTKTPMFSRISLSASKVLPQPPPLRKQNRNTFFQCTALSAGAGNSGSFDISPQFVSERYNAIRNKLRRDGQWNFSHKSFSFVY